MRRTLRRATRIAPEIPSAPLPLRATLPQAVTKFRARGPNKTLERPETVPIAICAAFDSVDSAGALTKRELIFVEVKSVMREARQSTLRINTRSGLFAEVTSARLESGARPKYPWRCCRGICSNFGLATIQDHDYRIQLRYKANYQMVGHPRAKLDDGKAKASERRSRTCQCGKLAISQHRAKYAATPSRSQAALPNWQHAAGGP
jgi:hypothetical protein